MKTTFFRFLDFWFWGVWVREGVVMRYIYIKRERGFDWEGGEWAGDSYRVWARFISRDSSLSLFLSFSLSLLSLPIPFFLLYVFGFENRESKSNLIKNQSCWPTPPSLTRFLCGISLFYAHSLGRFFTFSINYKLPII